MTIALKTSPAPANVFNRSGTQFQCASYKWFHAWTAPLPFRTRGDEKVKNKWEATEGDSSLQKLEQYNKTESVWRTADPRRVHLQPWLCTSAVFLWLLHTKQSGNSEINRLIRSNDHVIFSLHILIYSINGVYLWIYKLIFVFPPYLVINKENFEYCKGRHVWGLMVQIEGELCV